MKADDFWYDGLTLSEMGYTICQFDGQGLQTVSNGSEITFNTVPTLNGVKSELVSTTYDSCLETTFQICKTQCDGSDLEISFKEARDLINWLNRRGFHKLKFLDDDWLDVYFETSFNVSRIEQDGTLVGFELTMKTNRPFALREPVVMTLQNTEPDGVAVINDISDEEGCLYPHMEITIAADGNLEIHNDLEDRTTVIKNCTAGEIITLDYPIIQSSLPFHKIQDDFNWVFFRIANKFKNKRNGLRISIPCTLKVSYAPVVKVGL